MSKPVAAPGRAAPIAWAVAATLTVVAAVGLGTVVGAWRGYIDLDVYRAGARALLDGRDVYGPLPPVQTYDLPFTYPPLAAIAFTPLALLGSTAAAVAMFAVSLAALGATLWLVTNRLAPTWTTLTRYSVVATVLAVACFAEPVRATFSFGQVNIVLMLIVVADLLVVAPKWPRGLLIGIAIAIKLTPAGFLLFFLLRRDWKSLITAIATTLTAIAVVFAVLPRDSADYWFHKLAQTSRIGAPHFAANQSLHGAISRIGISEPAMTVVWLLTVAAVVAAGAFWMHRLLAAGALVAAMGVNAVIVLLVSPVSWSHHWVWVAPLALAAGLGIGRRPLAAHRYRYLAVRGVGAVIFFIGPHQLLPNSHDVELRWSWWQQVVGASYVLFAVGVVAAGVLWSSRQRGQRPTTPVASTSSRITSASAR